MTFMQLIVLWSLGSSLISVHGKVALRSGKIADIGNAIGETKPEVDTKVFVYLPTTVIPNTDAVDARVNVVQEISNSIDDDIEQNETKIDEAHKTSNQTCEIAPESCGSRTNDTEKPTALILTPLIEEGRICEARNASKVNSKLFLGVESYSGYFTVNKMYNSNIFFWYFPVENKPVNTTPWIVWLQGGPGASSMTGLFEEIGPFVIDSAFALKRNEFSWLQNHSLVFFDNPVGAGFSFTEHSKGYTRDMPTYSGQLYSAFRQFLELFPELRSAPLYIAGESYAGKYVPSLGVEIHKSNSQINLQGFLIGNAYVDPAVIPQLARPFYNFGLIEQEQSQDLKPLVDALKREVTAKNSTLAKVKWMNLVSLLLTMSHQSHAYNFLRNDLMLGRYVRFLNTPRVQKAIHVREMNFSFVNMTVNAYLASDFLSSSRGHFETLLDHYRVLAYCGQLDLMMPCITTSENYRTWKWNGTEQFIKAKRLPYLYKNKRAGYYKSGGSLTEVVFLGAGHMVPLDIPGPARDLVTRWSHNQKLGPRFSLLEGTFIGDFIKNNSIVPYL
ncbi:unnamed protein product, partial [Iphiclides podalirius]